MINMNMFGEQAKAYGMHVYGGVDIKNDDIWHDKMKQHQKMPKKINS